MKIGIIFGRNSTHQKRAAQLFEAGLIRHGQAPLMCDSGPVPPFCDLYVMWGWKRRSVMERVRRRQGRCVVMELGYIGDRSHWISLGYDGLNGRADFYADDVPGDRLARHFPDLLKPWCAHGGYALIMGQAPGDAALSGLHVQRWANEQAVQLRAMGLEARFRPHPVRPPEGQVRADYTSGTLADALAGAGLVVTYNSNSAVDAVCAGVPAISYDRGSMAWDVTSHSLADPPAMPDRQRWAERLAYCQWSPDEISSGEAWDHVRGGLDSPSRAGIV